MTSVIYGETRLPLARLSIESTSQSNLNSGRSQVPACALSAPIAANA
jgi:hypothetical protein